MTGKGADYGRKLTAEGPRVIGLMVSTLQSGNSVDRAIRTVSKEGPKLSAELFAEAVRMADCRRCSGTCDALNKILSDVPDSASGYRRAIGIVMSAASSTDRDECRMLLKEAGECSLEAVRMMGERYCASLNAPCLTVYGLGIMVPMLLMSILPLLGVGGMFGSGGFDVGAVSAITLVLIPSILACVCVWMRMANPFPQDRKMDVRRLYPLLLSIPLCISNYMMTGRLTNVVILGVAPAILVALIMDVGNHRAEIRRREAEKTIMGCFTDIGERIQEGCNCDTAVLGSMDSHEGLKDVCRRLMGSLSVLRGDYVHAVTRSISPISVECAQSLRDVMACSLKDNNDAGKLALMLGRQYINRQTVTEEMAIRLKSLTDMMLATAAVFAPLVLGMSVAMLGPLSGLTGHNLMDDVNTVLGTYLIELCATISVLISCIRMDDVGGNSLWRFAVLTPMSLLVFTVCSAISI